MIYTFSLSFLSPILLIAVSLVAFARPGRRPGNFPYWSEWAALSAFFMSLCGMVQILAFGPMQTGWGSGWSYAGLQGNSVTLTMTILVSFIGWIVLRFSRRYLDGETDEGACHGLMLATIAAVLVFVQSASLLTMLFSTIAVGLSLRQLLLVYRDRPQARRAAAKFSLVWHAGDAAFLIAALLLFLNFNTQALGQLAMEATGRGLGLMGQIGVTFLVLAAMLKSAAFPLHGWLTEVMEAPTPVSALLHAGIINAGGVMLIYTSALVQMNTAMMAALVMVGGLTALFGAAVMLTQSAIKTALAWSTIAQMGFMLLQCGLGLWPLALLHIVAHSLYKAHAFLSSGGAVSAVVASRRLGPVAVPSVGVVLRSFVLAVLLYGLIALLFSVFVEPKSAQALALGTILVFGVAYLVAQGLADLAPAALTRRTALLSVVATIAYFSLQALSITAWGHALPAPPDTGPLEWALIVLALVSFGMVAFAQALFPLWAHHPAVAGLRVHLANGLYLNALLDRAIGGFQNANSNT
ncbi:proton-conducting transporter membrane subunit [Rhizobium sp. L1K21]|uniref:proton-conducting transporter transmembrane domain-containing protein n=1 Tax=Rhizobium sp. L1K21 TaxID=2954933 RepID=UPI002093C1D3|nr:proton-conducting transporter membrane subunit [Rhizobium sp. L1K21]MCO6188599.1 oxidoreductase [Rhizobium sp. L1K21]